MNPWKLATFGIVGVLVTSLATGLGTAWFMRPAAADSIASAPSAQPYYATQVVRPRTMAAQPSAMVRPAAVRPVAATADCATTGDRMMRIAKPGLFGGLLGAGLGAAGGAIANGGKAAGKGAVIGGLAGAALGAGYGAYKTKNECGTILGGSGFTGGSAASPAVDQTIAYAPSRPAATSATRTSEGITVFNAGSTLPR
jgi:hypothetical protein